MKWCQILEKATFLKQLMPFFRQLEWTLEALNRHFFTQTEARPLLGSLQSRNRLMIQLRILKDSGN